jgi:iron complex transport system permease protein
LNARPVTRARFARVLAGGALVVLAGLVLASALGAESVDVFGVLFGGASDVERTIFLEIRLPRVLLAALVGGALAMAGVAFQALLRNPLAEPYLLGISGGGSFGAVLAIVVMGTSAAPLVGRAPAALVGCLLALGLVYVVASRRGALHPATLILAGVVTNAFFLAALACVQYAASPEESQAILRWVMGGLSGQGADETLLLAVTVPPALAALLFDARRLDLLAFGEETARSLGVDVRACRRRVFLGMSILTAICVSVSGPIGFVGLIVPHAARMVVGADHRVLIPAAFCAGAAFLPAADALARLVVAPGELPVGIVTAVVGAPAFVALMVRSRVAEGGGDV